MELSRAYAEYLLFQLGPSTLHYTETLIFAMQDVKSFSSGVHLFPEYVARVSWGHEWNKYNRTHYNAAHPPPKVERGYKFDLFYYELPEHQQVKYKKILTEQGWEDTMCYVEFSTGSPYKNIRFRIRNLPFLTNPRKGYKCLLKDKIFSLYFNFRSLRYTRI